MPKALARAAELYSNATELQFGSMCAEGAGPFAALPDSCWRAAASVSGVPAAAVGELVRVCPALRQLKIPDLLAYDATQEEGDSAGAALCAALEALAAVEPTLQDLDLQVRPLSFRLGCAPRAGAALARLRRLTRLSVLFRGPEAGGGAELVAAALPALSRLTALSLERVRQVSLAAWPCALPPLLVDLHLSGAEDAWFVAGLQASPPLVHLTRLRFAG